MFDWDQILENPPEWLEVALEETGSDVDSQGESEPSLGFI